MLQRNSWNFRSLLLLAPDGPSGGATPSPGGGSPSGGTSNSPPSSAPSSTPSPSAAPSTAPGPSAASSAPSSAPVSPASPGGLPPAPGAAPTTPGADTAFNFSALFEEPEVLAEPAAPPPAAPQTPAQTPQAPAPEQAAPQAPATADARATGQQDGGAQQQPVQSPQFDPADPISLARGLVQNQAAAIEHLAQTQFQLTQPELEAMESDPGQAIPRLLARTAVFMQQQFLTQLSRVVPMQIQRHGELLQRHSSNEDKFYASWPQLDRAKHGAMVRELGQRYRQLNPDVTLEQMIKDLGPFVLHRAGLPLAAPGVAAPQGTPVQAKPAVASAPNGSQVFTPASPGVAVHTQQVEDGGFAFLGQHGE